MQAMALPATMTLVSWLALAAVVYLLSLAIYRLFLSPLSIFPGPKTAAFSWLDEAYHSIIRKGQYVFHLDDLHDRYGPIVRITPNEVHIKDSSFWEEVFVRRPKQDKDPSLLVRFGGLHSTFTTVDAAWHKRLRAPLNPFFSRRSILAQEELVQEKVDLLFKGFDSCHANDSVISVSGAFAALTADVISHYGFGFSYGQLETDNWEGNLEPVYRTLNEVSNIIVQLPWLNTVLSALPDILVEKLDPDFGRMLRLRKNLTDIIIKIRQELENGNSGESPTIFHAMMLSDLPPPDKTDQRLGDEAHTVIGAGIVTTAWAITNSLFYILADPTILARLQKELQDAIPDVSVSGAFSYEKLEKLPYLRGCVKEGIRQSYGLSSRLGRVFHEPLQYKGWSIPPGTVVSMSSRDVTFDQDIFTDPDAFRPERWERSATKGDIALDHYFVTFSAGPRMCLGVNLAYMEMYVTLSRIFRRYSLQLYDTDRSDVALMHDFFTPNPKLDTKGVRVKILDTFQ